jgi:hypothetical protein
MLLGTISQGGYGVIRLTVLLGAVAGWALMRKPEVPA